MHKDATRGSEAGTEVSACGHLLVVIDPAARRSDGESVRIAKDVLGAGAPARVCLPEDPAEFARALTRRGSRRPVVIGDDHALLRAVAVLHRERELDGCPLSLVPVGSGRALHLARSLGVPTGVVAAARAVLEGVERQLDLLVDDSGGVVLDALRIPSPGSPGGEEGGAVSGVPPGLDAPGWLRHCHALLRNLAARPTDRPDRPQPPAPAASTRLRVEADGVTLADLDRPVAGVSLAPTADGLAEVEVRPWPGGDTGPLVARARTVTVSGPDFRYRADALVAGPVRTRTWTAHAKAWSLTLPG
ncbi:diacylglycerol kinase [Streptomyces sp. NPDC058045]|uniref:diacylglycerol kinase n=1 Tax=Streptomyces sp. NPDC058045 TaxID=3346311 RepID=UPI0036E6F321